MNELTEDQKTIAELQQQITTMGERLIESETIRTLFISNMLNEINNPITSILGLSQPIPKVKNIDNDQINETLNWIHEEAKFLGFQLSNVFAAAELESGSLQIEPKMVDVHGLWSKVCTSYINVMQLKHVRLRTNGHSLLPSSYSERVLIASDSRLLSLIFMNLFDNAIKVAPEGSYIDVDFWLNNEGLTIRIADTGIGITSEDQSKIFDRFRQLNSSTTKQFRGMGLGLSIVTAAASMLSGHCSIDSAPTEGTSLTVHVKALSYVDLEQEDSFDNAMFFGSEKYYEQGSSEEEIF